MRLERMGEVRVKRMVVDDVVWDITFEYNGSGELELITFYSSPSSSVTEHGSSSTPRA